MERNGRRILLAVEPGVLEGALAEMLSECFEAEVAQTGRGGAASGCYDAAIVSDRLPLGVRAAVVITLPDTRGSGGTGTVSTDGVVREVQISGPEVVIQLLDQHVPPRRARSR